MDRATVPSRVRPLKHLKTKSRIAKNRYFVFVGGSVDVMDCSFRWKWAEKKMHEEEPETTEQYNFGNVQKIEITLKLP